MMYRIKEIKKLLQFYDYAPVVRKIDDGVIVKLPHPRLLDRHSPRLVKVYSIKRGSGSGLFYNSNRATDEKFVPIPEYAIRLFLMSDISACCGQISVSDLLILYIDEEGVEREDLESIVDSPSNEEERSKEGFLIKLFIEARKDNFHRQYEEVARTHNTDVGYRIIKSFFEG